MAVNGEKPKLVLKNLKNTFVYSQALIILQLERSIFTSNLNNGVLCSMFESPTDGAIFSTTVFQLQMWNILLLLFCDIETASQQVFSFLSDCLIILLIEEPGGDGQTGGSRKDIIYIIGLLIQTASPQKLTFYWQHQSNCWPQFQLLSLIPGLTSYPSLPGLPATARQHPIWRGLSPMVKRFFSNCTGFPKPMFL